jgi:hypothetical protein
MKLSGVRINTQAFNSKALQILDFQTEHITMLCAADAEDQRQMQV